MERDFREHPVPLVSGKSPRVKSPGGRKRRMFQKSTQLSLIRLCLLADKFLYAIEGELNTWLIQR